MRQPLHLRFVMLIPAAHCGLAIAREDPTDTKGVPASEIPPGVKIIRDVEYAKVGGLALQLDLYIHADTRTPAPVVLYFHGGGWRNGNKSNCLAGIPLAVKGYVVASVNYRLSQQAIFPAAIEDCKGAVRFLRANAAKYGVDPAHVAVMGDSAGGHLAALLGTSGGSKELEGATGGNLEQSSRVQAVVDYYGPIDFIAILSQKSDIKRGEPGAPEVQLLGGRTLERKDLAIQASPLTYVTKDDPPFLIVHGEKDPRVPREQPQALLEALQAAGVEARLHLVKNAKHGFNAAERNSVIPILTEFLDKHLKDAAGKSPATAP